MKQIQPDTVRNKLTAIKRSTPNPIPNSNRSSSAYAVPQIRSKLINSTSSSSSNPSQKSDKHIANNQTRRLFDFIQKQKASASGKDMRTDNGGQLKMKSNHIESQQYQQKKKSSEKLINSNDALNGNGNGIDTKTIKTKTGDPLKLQKLGNFIEFSGPFFSPNFQENYLFMF